MCSLDVRESQRAYGFFDALNARPSELPEEPGERDAYLEGYRVGMEERESWNTPTTPQEATGLTISVDPPLCPCGEGIVGHSASCAARTPRWERRAR